MGLQLNQRNRKINPYELKEEEEGKLLYFLPKLFTEYNDFRLLKRRVGKRLMCFYQLSLIIDNKDDAPTIISQVILSWTELCMYHIPSRLSDLAGQLDVNKTTESGVDLAGFLARALYVNTGSLKYFIEKIEKTIEVIEKLEYEEEQLNDFEHLYAG